MNESTPVTKQRKFARIALGQIVATPAALSALGPEAMKRIAELLGRHASGDWGNVCEEDALANDEASIMGERVLSAYPIDPRQPSAGHGENTVWIITEWCRTLTTVLLPSDY